MDPLGIVPTDARGSLPYALVHGESLVAAASWALTTAGVQLFDYSISFETVQDAGRPLVIHDPLCPLTPAGFIEEAVEECEQSGAIVVGVRPVTDTVKEYDAPTGSGATRWLGSTVDREGLVCVTSPVVLPAAVVGALERLETDDLARLVADLSTRFPVRLLQAPPLGRRIAGEPDIEVLDALSRATG